MSGRDFSLASHLPNQRSDRQPAPAERLPRQRNGVTPQMHGRYPDHNVLDQVDHWDEETRRVVLARLEQVPEMRFFTPDEQACLGAFCDLVTAQDREPRIPVLNMVDAKLSRGEFDGFRYADMPEDDQTWRRVAAGLDAAARQRAVPAGFARAPDAVKRGIVQAFSEGALHGEIWEQLPCDRAWSVVTRGVLGAFYSHPWAWNEIGFGGPAYPRGYARLGPGQREVWEGAAASDDDPVREPVEP